MGFKPKSNMPPMERELSYLLYDLCVFWGFCISEDNWQRITQSKVYTSDKFAKDVLKAEDMDYSIDDKWVKKISQKFIDRFGDDKIDDSTFIDRVRGIKENW